MSPVPLGIPQARTFKNSKHSFAFQSRIYTFQRWHYRNTIPTQRKHYKVFDI